jgi:hypothetical protein
MLPSEIEPFAQAHIALLRKKSDEINELLAATPDDWTIAVPREILIQWLVELADHRHAFYRFQQCMIDEHKMKDRAENKLRELRRK